MYRTKMLFSTFYSDGSPCYNRAGAALVHPGIVFAHLLDSKPGLTAGSAGIISGGVPHQAAVFVPQDVAWLGSDATQDQTASFNGLTVLQGFDDGWTPLWYRVESSRQHELWLGGDTVNGGGGRHRLTSDQQRGVRSFVARCK